MLTSAGEAQKSVLEVANTPVLWLCAIGVFGIIVVQSLIYYKAAKTAGPAAGLTEKDLSTALRAGAVSAIGPSMAVVLVAIALLSLFGTPAVLVRIGLVGSAAYETGAASIAAGTAGAALGDSSYTSSIFGVVFAAITMGGVCWMIATLIYTPLLKRGDHKLRTVNPMIMTLIPTAAMIAAFTSVGLGEAVKSSAGAIAFVVGGLAMLVVLLIQKATKINWLKEWALGLSILVSFAVLYVML